MRGLGLWPGFDSRTRRHMWVEFVVGSLIRGLFSRFSDFPPTTKNQHSKFQFDLEMRATGLSALLSSVTLKIRLVIIMIIIMIIIIMIIIIIIIIIIISSRSGKADRIQKSVLSHSIVLRDLNTLSFDTQFTNVDQTQA